MTALLFLGGALGFIGWIWFLAVAFQEGIFWGFACLLLPFASLFFVFAYWKEAKHPFLLSLAGGICVVYAKSQLNLAS